MELRYYNVVFNVRIWVNGNDGEIFLLLCPISDLVKVQNAGQLIEPMGDYWTIRTWPK
jgi:hypothetical protein